MDEQPVPTQPLPVKTQTPSVKKIRVSIFIVLGVFFVFIVCLVLFLSRSKKQDTKIVPPTVTTSSFENTVFEKDTIKKFASDTEFTSLMSEVKSRNSLALPITGGGMAEASGLKSMASTATDQTVDRSSTTNVQVVGIDEPDIVKTDSSSIYYSKTGQYRYYTTGAQGIDFQSNMMISRQIMPPQYSQTSEIVAVGAVPPSTLKMQSSIPESGEMLISDKVLVVFTTDTTNGNLQLVGYSITNPNTPKKLWELPFSGRSQKIAARLYKNTLYLVTSTSPTFPKPCPMPLVAGKVSVSVQCTDIYMPSSRPISNSVYSVLKINPQTGGVEKTLSFIGQLGQSTVYMSPESLYLSYEVEGNSISILNQFIAENQGMFPQYIEEKIKKLDGYDLSLSTKEVEMNSLLSQYLTNMASDEKLKQENQLVNAFKKFLFKYKRSMEYTGIIKINNNDLTITASGKVPGVVLNQFSFDEWKGNLRVATTIGGRNPFYMIGGSDLTSQISDAYVLGPNLEVKGYVKDLGKTERIYFVRFIEDRGYIVTFRQTDPFYVLDLSNPNSPLVKGELKIPGYSSYLHPIDTHLILGIGRENQVKLSLFDVTDPTNPKEVSHYDLASEYYSAAMDNHHAFLQDPKYKVFFLPGSRGGYIFSYEANTLSLVKALEASTVKRGLYLNDYMYIVSDLGITSFKEGTWEKVGEFTYEKKETPVVPTIIPLQTVPSPVNSSSGSASVNPTL
ncbi:MAG: beta-propeller domain-containing protein [Candidatus Roizmanbacteria bacterium]|nr:beta-propeller domain-containing protein [Candidatus Roizmanbacteria bacterium]